MLWYLVLILLFYVTRPHPAVNTLLDLVSCGFPFLLVVFSDTLSPGNVILHSLVNNVPPTTSFICIREYADEGDQEFISCLWISIFHHKFNPMAHVVWDKWGERNLKNPTEGIPLFIQNPHPHYNHLLVTEVQHEKVRRQTYLLFEQEVTSNHMTSG